MNNTPTFGLQFIARHKSKKTEMAGIYLRITVNHRKSEVSTKLQCPKKLWDKSKERVKSDGVFNHRHINRHLDDIRTKVQSIYQELRNKEQLITPTIIKNHFQGNKEEGYTLLRLLNTHYNTYMTSLGENTMRHYKTTHRYLKAFLKGKKKVDDIYLRQIDYQFISDYEAFLRTWQPVEMGQRTLAHNTVMRHQARLRTLINYAIKLGWMQHYPYKAYKISYKTTSRKYLSHDELESIINKKFTIQRLAFARDMFLFSCYTGLAYSDVMLLTPEHIVKGIDGNNWLYTQRKKTETTLRIPLLPVAERIIDKYKDDPKAIQKGRLFPIPSNQKLNGYLKEVAALCGIAQNLTFHMARHTFATTITLSNNVPIETVSKMLGHTKIATTQIYAKVIESKISKDMNILRQKLESDGNNQSISVSV